MINVGGHTGIGDTVFRSFKEGKWPQMSQIIKKPPHLFSLLWLFFTHGIHPGRYSLLPLSQSSYLSSGFSKKRDNNIYFFFYLKCWNNAQLLWNSISLKHVNRQVLYRWLVWRITLKLFSCLILQITIYFAYFVPIFKCEH